jgi:hypothetical protein
MKNIKLKWLYASLLIVLLSVLTGCSVPKYSYDKEDAGTVFLSLTSNFAMSRHMANWQIVFEAIDEKAKKELPGFGLTTSAKIYGWAGKPEEQFKILTLEKFGNVMQSTKIAPGKYKVRSVNIQDALVKNNLPVPFKVVFNNENIKDSVFPLIKTSNQKTFPDIEFVVESGKAVYLGSFNAGMYDCKDIIIFNSCDKFHIVMDDEFKRDSLILKEQLSKQANVSKFEFLNRVLKIDRSKSPFLFSEL